MNYKILNELKKHRFKRDAVSPFSTHIVFSEWADLVSPLLSFDQNLKNKFQQRKTAADVTNKLSPGDYISNINECIGTVNEAVTALEIKLDQERIQKNKTNSKDISGVKPPEKITLKWLWEHVPAIYFWSFIILLFAVFSLGIKFSETNFYKSLMNKEIVSTQKSTLKGGKTK